MNVVITMKTADVQNALKNAPGKIRASVLRTVTLLTTDIQASVIGDKLSGQVLHVRTGNLRGSVNKKVIESDKGYTGIVGTNVIYGRIHEYGFNGSVNVKAHLRMMNQAWGREVRNPHQVNVRSHSMTMRVPEKSFLRSTLKDFQPRILRDLKKAASKALKE